MLKKIGLFIAGSLLTLLLFLTVFATTAVVVITPNNLKAWLAHSGAYDTLVDNIVSESVHSQDKITSDDVPLDDPRIKAALNEAFSPEFLKSSAEQIIDGFNRWLIGESAKPEFSVDVSHVKNTFADKVGAITLARYNKLPACAAGQEPVSTDILKINCRPAGYDLRPDIDKAVKDLKNNDSFLPDKTVTFDTLDKNSSLQSNLDTIPRWYQRAQFVPYILGVLSLLAVAGVFFLSPTRRKGLKRVMVSLYVITGFLMVYAWLMALAFKRLSEELAKGEQHDFQESATNILKQVQTSVNHAFWPWIVGFATVATGIAVYLFITRNKTPASPKPDEQPADESMQTKPIGEPRETKGTPKSSTKPSKPPKLVQ